MRKLMLSAVVFGVLLGAVWISIRPQTTKQSPVSPATRGLELEIDQIKHTFVLKEQSKLYTQLIERVGPVEAQMQLFRSGLPFDGQTHLLNHTVGDWLYHKYGDSGLVYCKDFFLSSCFHGFVLDVIAKEGVGKLPTVMDSCWKVGPGTATQCAHGIGHGLLAFNGYKNLTQSLKDCDQVAASSPNFPSLNCYDGVFMENIYAVHNDGKPSPDRWIKDSDPVYPCNDPRIDPKYIQACWMDQPFWITQMYKGDTQKVGLECNKLTAQNLKFTCFDALARQIHPIAQGSIDKVMQLCGAMPQGWTEPCEISIVGAAFSVGDRQLPFQICERIMDQSKGACYQNLIGVIHGYVYNADERQNLCSQIPSRFNHGCIY